MADYLRQLRNDEKRRTFSMVASVTPEIATVATTAIPLFVIPKRSTIARIYVVNKDAFAVGSTVGEVVIVVEYTQLDTEPGLHSLEDI